MHAIGSVPPLGGKKSSILLLPPALGYRALHSADDGRRTHARSLFIMGEYEDEDDLSILLALQEEDNCEKGGGMPFPTPREVRRSSCP